MKVFRTFDGHSLRIGIAGAVMALAGAASAAPPAAQSKNCDAAVQYWQAFDRIPHMNEQEQKIAADWKTVPLDAAAQKLLESSENALKQLHRGSECDHCDWGLRKEDGYMLLLPHLSKSRELARLACLRTRFELEHGQSAPAAQDVLDTLVLARRAGQDNLILGILVQDAMQQLAIDATTPSLKKLDGPALRELSAQLSKLPPGGSLDLSMEFEEQCVGQFIEKLRNAPATGKPLDQVLKEVLGDSPENPIHVTAASPQAAIDELNAVLPLMRQFPAALRLPHAQAQAKLAELKQQASKYPIGNLVVPNMDRAYMMHTAAQARFLMFQAAIAVITGEQDQLKNFKDPANGEPFKYRGTKDGFELTSQLKRDDKQVTLTVGVGGE